MGMNARQNAGGLGCGGWANTSSHISSKGGVYVECVAPSSLEMRDGGQVVSGLDRGQVRKLVPDLDLDHHPDPTYLGRVLLGVSQGLGWMEG